MARRAGKPVMEIDGMLMASVGPTRTGDETGAADRLGKPVRVTDLQVPGPTGPQGAKGDPGAAGSAGPKGDMGSQGPKGEAGSTGAQGPKGDTGPAGAAGPKGDTGATGSQGPMGSTGATGSTGPAGASPYVYAGKVTTLSTGLASVTFPAGKFTAAPIVSATVEAASNVCINAQVVAGSVTATGCQVKAWSSALALLVLGNVNTPASGAVVHVTAVPAS